MPRSQPPRRREHGRAGRRRNAWRAGISFAVAFAAVIATAGCASAPDQTASDPTAVAEPQLASPDQTAAAVATVRDYLAEKPWGFFGATCAQWLDIDYLANEAAATIADDDPGTDAVALRVEIRRRPERVLGPETLVYTVDLEAGTVQGDNARGADDGRLGTTEGCDGW